MNRPLALFGSLLILQGLWVNPLTAQAPKVSRGFAEIRIVFLRPSYTASTRHPLIVSVRNLRSGKDFAPLFHPEHEVVSDGQEYRYFAPEVPYGKYEIRASLATDKQTIVRIVEIGHKSEKFYFSGDMTKAHLMVVDPLGGILHDITVLSALDNFGTEYASAFDKNLSADVPSGLYKVRAAAKGFGSVPVEVCFCQPEAWSVLSATVPGGDSDYPDASVRVSGTIEVGDGVKNPIIIRMSPVYSQVAMTAVVVPGTDGKFEMSGDADFAEVGKYVVLVSQAGKIIGNSIIEFPREKPVSFRLETGASITFRSRFALESPVN